MTDPRDYLADVLAKGEGHQPIDIEPSETVCAACAIIPGLPGVYRTDGEWPCAEEREATLARALLAVLDRHVPVTVKIAAHDGAVTERITCRHCLWLDGEDIYNPADVPMWPCPDYTTITTELAKEIEYG